MSRSKGQSLLEYVLIASLIALAAVIALTFLDGRITTAFNSIKDTL